MKDIIIKIIGIITALPGFYYLISGFQGHIFAVSEIFKGNIHSENMPWLMTIITLLMIIVLVLRIVTGYGLVRLKTWGKNLAVSVLSIDLVIRFAGFINMWTYYDRHPEAVQLVEELEKSVASGQIEIMMKISMIPSYVIAGVGIISIIVLLSLDFNNLEAIEHNKCINT